MGVLTTCDVAEGRCFGPLPSTLSSVYFIAQAVLRQQPPDVPMMKIDMAPQDGKEFWLPFVRPALFEQEQNLELCLAQGGLYYRAQQDIAAGTELLVWYSPQLKQAIGLAPVNEKERKDKAFVCPYCKQEYDYPNPMTAHVLLQCQLYANTLPGKNQRAADELEERANGFCVKHEYGNIKRKFCERDPEMNGYMKRLPTHRTDKDKTEFGGSAFRKIEKSSTPPLTTSESCPNSIVYQPVMSYASAFLYRRLCDGPQTSYFQMLNFSNKEPCSFDGSTPSRKVRHSMSPPQHFSPHSDVSLASPTSKLGSPVSALLDTSLMLLSPPANTSHVANLAQNWCAKCNASFRMTSDLVYHMRSHHKRDCDVGKKRRDEKLSCAICNERFRERHHLTRHMTSHD